jgi:SAM-dependent methyltransferase
MMSRQRRLINDSALSAAVQRYAAYSVASLAYGTVRDYCESFDHLRPLATANQDLKDLQRPWMLKAVLSQARRGGRLLEIGAGEPLVAELLRRSGHEVWVVDPYDGSGNGPRDFHRYCRTYRGLKFIRDRFSDSTPGLEDGYFDCIYSISVLEHLSADEFARSAAGLKRFLKPGGISIHAVDHVHRGRGADNHLQKLRMIATAFGSSVDELDRALQAMSADTETYYLSAESHNRWRGTVPYADFPMRVCVSIHFCTGARELAVPVLPKRG